MKKLVLISLVLIVLPGLCPAQDACESPGRMVINGDLKASIKGMAGAGEYGGRLSAMLVFSPGSPGSFQVEGFNVVLFGVDQELITGRAPEGKPTGVLGFALDPAAKNALEYDPKSNALVGSIGGRMDLPQLMELSGYKVDPEVDDVDGPTLAARLELHLDLGPDFSLEAARKGVGRSIARMEAGMEVADSDHFKIKGLHADLRSDWIITDYTIFYYFEFARRLCLQPVRISSLHWHPPYMFFTMSGDGLAFGMPGARTEWTKADVVFQVRDWKTVFNSAYSTLDSSEELALLATVQDDDCIEVFFTDAFSPASMHGGGATYYGGTSSSQIISSDGNADGGIDLTHLAHELGHVMTLKHPGAGYPKPSAPHRVDGSSGTLMCPSGYLNDNPTVNSLWNQQHVNNPLFTYVLKQVSPGPDCDDDADCGPCP